jgi:ribosomal protein S12 methylthiotransferase
MSGRYWIETLGCPKNQVDSDKIAGSLLAEGYGPAQRVEDADLVVVNTCAFIEEARAESIETILLLSEARRRGARLVVTGCLAARAGAELAASVPEIDLVADVGVPVSLLGGSKFIGNKTAANDIPRLDLLELPRPPANAPWAYVKIAEGCDRACGFCAIPSFRGPQRSRQPEAILGEIDELNVKEVILVAQDLASYGRDLGRAGALLDLLGDVSSRVARVRLLYLYPSSLSDELISAIAATNVAYFDLSLQHVSRALLRRMRRYGGTKRFVERIAKIRAVAPHAALRSSFICGYPGETEEDHDELLSFLREVELDWAGFFTFSEEQGTLACTLDDKIDGIGAVARMFGDPRCNHRAQAVCAHRGEDRRAH